MNNLWRKLASQEARVETISYEPQVGDTVSVQGHHGTFVITQVDPCSDNGFITRQLGRVDLEEIHTKFSLPSVPWSALYMDEILARRILENVRKENPFPDSILGYEIKSGADHEENPALYITFKVDGDESPAAIEKLAQFRRLAETSLHQEPVLHSWPYIQFSASRSALDVAS